MQEQEGEGTLPNSPRTESLQASGLLTHKVQDWDVFYQKAILEDGSAFFPEKLPLAELEAIRRTQGSYIFANQYMNQIIPEDEMRFKREWFRYYNEIPQRVHTIMFIDPAIGQEDHHDFTGICIIHGDSQMRWYVEVAKRLKLDPTQIVNIIFEMNQLFKPTIIGIEDVAYQKSMMYMLWEEERIRKARDKDTRSLPIVGVKPPTDKTKESKILSVLVPRMEYGRILFNQGLHDFEHELLTFPRGSHDDVLDAVASCDSIISYPTPERIPDVQHHPSTIRYEADYIKKLKRENS